MRSQITSRTRRRRLAAIASTLPILAALTLAAPALATAEPATGGNTTIALELPKRVKAEPLPPATANGTTVTLPNSTGTADIARGLITINLNGGIRFKANGRKADVTAFKMSFGSGNVTALVKGKAVGFATVGGAPVEGASLGASVTGATLLVTEDGAKALNKALAKKKKKGGKKGKAVASGAKRKPFRADARLGSVSTTVNLATVEVRPFGDVVLEPDIGAGLKFLGKGVNFVLGGISAVPPATAPTPAEFDFPVTGGRVTPDLTLGQITSAGGLLITKNANAGGLGPGPCEMGTTPHPIGTFVKQFDMIVDLERKSLLATLDSTGGFVGAGVVSADLDMSDATTTVNPNGTATIEGMVVRITAISASTLNAIFGMASEGCGADFAAGDSLGHLSVSIRIG
jgi:hypothetical protein